MTNKESHILCDEIHAQIKKLNITMRVMAAFLDIPPATIVNIRRGRQLTYSEKTGNKIRAGLDRIKNGEFDEQVIKKQLSSKTYDYETAYFNTEKHHDELEHRKLDGERRKQEIIRKAKIAELAKYGKTTIGDKHITDGIA